MRVDLSDHESWLECRLCPCIIPYRTKPYAGWDESKCFCKQSLHGPYPHMHLTKPVPGMGATQGVGSDRYPYTVDWVSPNLRRVVLRRCEFERTDDAGPFTENQHYRFFEETDTLERARLSGEGRVYTLRKNGRYVMQGQPMRGGSSFTLGHRDAYRDPSF
jgi:hypothetical protein